MEEKKNEQRELGRDEVFAEIKEVIEMLRNPVRWLKQDPSMD